MAETILTADTDRQLVRALGRAFTQAGYQPLEAHDGEQAIAVTLQEQPSLVVLDITLPKRDGFAVLEAIRAMPYPVGQTPVLLTCGGRVTAQYEARAHALGAQGIVVKPVPLKDLLGLVKKLTAVSASASQRAGAASGAGSSDDASREFAGLISEMQLPYSLHLLHGQRATGVLVISTARKKKAIELRNGYPVAVKSNLVTECLGHYLVRAGMVSEDVANESISRMKKGGGLQGEILLAMNVITTEEIAAALKAQAEEKLFEMFAWRHGEFRLERGSRLRRANALAFEKSAANIILEGIRLRTQQEEVDEFLARNADRQVRLSPSSRYQLAEVDLTDEERALVLALDGTARLGDLAAVDLRRQRTLYGLLATEVLELRSDLGETVSGRASAATEGKSDEQARTAAVAQMEPSAPEPARPASESKAQRVRPRERGSRGAEAFDAGENLLKEKRYEQALREFGIARESSSRNADYLAHYAWCLYLCNSNNATVTQEALAHLRQAVKLAKDSEKPYLLLGRLCKVLGQVRDAETNFERAAKIRPDCVEALRELRLINMRKGKTRELLGKLIRR